MFFQPQFPRRLHIVLTSSDPMRNNSIMEDQNYRILAYHVHIGVNYDRRGKQWTGSIKFTGNTLKYSSSLFTWRSRSGCSKYSLQNLKNVFKYCFLNIVAEYSASSWSFISTICEFIYCLSITILFVHIDTSWRHDWLLWRFIKWTRHYDTISYNVSFHFAKNVLRVWSVLHTMISTNYKYTTIRQIIYFNIFIFQFLRYILKINPV